MSKICPRCSELLPDDAGFCPFDGAKLQKTSDPFLGKTIAARYRLTKKLGAGGMALVYLARHELISRQSAIKILRPEFSRTIEHRERFLREARAVNRVNHANIVEITDVGESDGIAYLVMEYVEGETLLAQIQQGPLRWERAVRIAVQVAGALARTHQLGIIHRDLKPENILLVPNKEPNIDGASEGDRVKLTDFGIAKMTGEPTLTLNQQLFGTPGYIAPEYVSGLPIDGRADIYSLAVVLYEMITGVLPFEGRGQSELLLKPLTCDPIPPSRRIGGLPASLEAFLLRCLARDPAARPHDAFAFHDALVDIVRRFAVGVDSRKSTGFVDRTAGPREPSSTVVDPPSTHHFGLDAGARAAERIATGEELAEETVPPWVRALSELEASIARARRIGGEAGTLASRAAELALVAEDIVLRRDRASKVVGDLQVKVDRLETTGREFRANVGHAIDVLVHDRSREHAHLDALRAKRMALGTELGVPSSEASHDTILVADERHAEHTVADLDFQIETLHKQLDGKNEEHELALVQATGSLEGSLSALRRLTRELMSTIDEGLKVLSGV